MPNAVPWRFAFAAALLAGASLPGCAQCRLPAIDPTGEHIFSGTTTLAHHDLLGGGLFHHRQPPAVAPAAPVAVVPPVKPPCQPPVEAVPVVPVLPLAPPPVVAVPQNPLPVMPVACTPQVALPGRPQPGGPICETPVAYRGPELTITPARIVAPVNTEVVMAAGICSPSGYYIMRQPMEWMLAQDGVGQIVAVGHESPHNASLILRSSPQKLATNYARAHTSTISQVLDRGTPTPADDVYLQKGQSWISITSPTEGQTSVVVWTPKEQNWDRRKATATIYWVDAAWKLPPSATARAGQPLPLVTVLTRSAGDPIAGWIVRYEAIDGPPASFRGAPAVEVRTDIAGRAIVDLTPASVEPGITTVRVQIIRPGIRPGDSQMIVGQGTIGVQWTTPGLSVRALGSSAVLADGAVGYRVEVTNNGDLATHNVALSYSPPAGLTVLNSTPLAQTFGQRLEWRLGDLPPGTTSVVEVNCRAAVAGSVRSNFVATSAEVPRAENMAQTEVRTNALVVKMVGPEAVEVGREAKFLIDVTNNGPTAVTNVAAADTFEPGLSHTGGERSPLVRPIPIIQPGQTERFAVSFIVAEPGRHSHRLDVTADGGHAAGARACVTGTAAVVTPPQLSVRLSGPPTSRPGEVAPYTVELKNTGSAPATNVALTINWSADLQLTEASSGHEDSISQLTTRWRIAQLAPGETQTRRLNFICRAPDRQGAIVRATVASDQTSAVMNQASTTILPRTGGSQSPLPSADIQADELRSPGTAGGGLRLSASVAANPISAGATTTLVINIINDRSLPDRDVALSVQALDDGLNVRPTGTSPTPVATASTSDIDFAPIREMRPGEQLSTPYRLEIRGIKPGLHKVRVTAISSLNSAGTSTDAEVIVNP